jgi:transposase
MIVEPRRQVAGVLTVSVHPDGERLRSAEDEEARERIRRRPHAVLVEPQLLVQTFVVSNEGTPDNIRVAAEDGTVLGVDLGIENLVVTSTASFVSGRELTHNLREFEKVRAGLQQTGTRSAHRTLEQSSRRELRYVRDVLHRASNALIDEALRYDCDIIAFEDLTHVRDRTGNSQLALKSGTVTPKSGFTAHPEGFEAEFMDKPRPPRANPSG